MLRSLFFASFCIVTIITPSDTAKILAALPFPSISHQVVFRPLTQELAKRGHEVTIITPDPVFTKGDTPANLTEIDVHDISYNAWKEGAVKMTKGFNGIVETFKHFTSAGIHISRVQLQSSQIQKFMNESREFDLILVEDCVRPYLIFGHIYKAPVIQISSLGMVYYNNDQFDIPYQPLLYPHLLNKKQLNLTMWDKMNELYDFALIRKYTTGPYNDLENDLLRSIFGPKVPKIEDMINNVDLLMLNFHPMWENNVPVPPNVVHIWGIHKKPENPLPEDIQSYLDNSKHGVIYMSFGTNAVPSTLNAERIQAFVKVFSQLPYDVLWKWDKDVLPGKSDNVRIGKWFPQSDLLRHPKVKLFITQGGLQSTEEAINAGVPLVGVPILGDQWYNVEKYLQFKIGVKLDIQTLTEVDVTNAIDTVLEDNSYRDNMIKLRTIMRDEPETALQRAVWWTEYVLRHKGAKHLKAAGAGLTWWQYYEINLICAVLFIFSVLVFACVFVIKRVLNVARTLVVTQSKLKDN